MSALGRTPRRSGRAAGAGTLPELAVPQAHLAAIRASRAASRGLHPDDEVDRWIAAERRRASLRTRIVPLAHLRGWQCRRGTGDLVHHTGRFFSVLGIHVRHRAGLREFSWDQPIIEQPEIGILGIVAKRIGGVLHVCLQAKEEPGNIGGVQLSPTVQATYSNYTCTHGGAAPPFLRLFTAPAPGSILFSRLQTEDGSRFLYKSNRNMIVLAGKEFPAELPRHFIWLTLRQVAALLRRDNLVNACARSVLAALAIPPDGNGGRRGRPTPHGGDGLAATLQWLDDWRAHHHFLTKPIGLNELREWGTDGKGFFSHGEGRFFRVIGLEVASQAREVACWNQPIIETAGRGIIGLLQRQRGGVREFLLHCRAEAGKRPTVQLAPTVEFTPANYHGNLKLPKPFLFDEFSAPGRFATVSETLQAEEGARFFRDCNIHRVLSLQGKERLEPPPSYRWVPEAHLRLLLHFGEQVNAATRSILACLL